MKNAILLHKAEDDVGIAVLDLKTGEEVAAVTLEGQPVGSVKVIQDVPLGHKVAMKKIPTQSHILEYGREIGYATQAIKAGEHVHVHNIKSLRWAGKTQIVERQEVKDD